MSGLPLRIEQKESSRAQSFHQCDQSDFRSVGDMVKHAFTKERAANGYSIESSGQITFSPHFDAVRMAQMVQFTIIFDNFRRNPCIAVARRASFDHGIEVSIETNFKRPLAQCALQSMRNVKTIIQRNNGAWIRRESADAATAVHRHREKRPPIAFENERGRQHWERSEKAGRLWDRKIKSKIFLPQNVPAFIWCIIF